MTPKYKGKSPNAIASISRGKQGRNNGLMLQSNNGTRYFLSDFEARATDLKRLPQLGEDIRYYIPEDMDSDYGANPLVRVKVNSPPQRPADTTAKPSKRLKARRSATKKAPEGFYANPLQPGIIQGKFSDAQKDSYGYMLEFFVQMKFRNMWLTSAGFLDQSDAVVYAKQRAKKDPNATFRVIANSDPVGN